MDLLDKIRSRGYWRVIIRPTDYVENKIGSLGEIKDIIRSKVLHLRGWDYPHISKEGFTYGQDYIESTEDFSTHKEFWRFYQSGQFVHVISMKEDWQEEAVSLFNVGGNSLQFKGLEILETLYRVSEIFEFASRLSTQGIYGKSLKIEITLNDTENRKLFFWDTSRYLSQDYICKIAEIKWSDIFSVDELIGNSSNLSLQATLFLIERFGWQASPDLLKKEQAIFMR